MKKALNTESILNTCIMQVSGKVNKKALQRSLDEGGNLNDIMLNYYLDISRASNDNVFRYLVYRDNLTIKEWHEVIKSYNGKCYKTPYDYVNGNKVKQKDTGLLLVSINGFYTSCSPVFDIYQWLYVNDILEAL